MIARRGTVTHSISPAVVAVFLSMPTTYRPVGLLSTENVTIRAK
jgi:hypothetical protein